jgi:uncharacterized protein YdaU (DUF1376 family)
MSERPFMQLYVSDYLGDTRHLSCEQHGAYLLLLMTMWNADGALPDDDKKLARCVGVTLKKWLALKPDVAEFFTIADGFWTHSRLTKERQKGERKSELRSAAGAMGGEAKALKYKKATVANAVANGQHLPEPYRKEAQSASVPTERVEVAEGSADFMALVAYRKGKSVVLGRNFTAWVTADELAAARAAYNIAA